MRAPFATAFVYKRSKKVLERCDELPSWKITRLTFLRLRISIEASLMIFGRRWYSCSSTKINTRTVTWLPEDCENIFAADFLSALCEYFYIFRQHVPKKWARHESQMSSLPFWIRGFEVIHTAIRCSVGSQHEFPNRFSLAAPCCQLCLHRAITIGQYLKFP